MLDFIFIFFPILFCFSHKGDSVLFPFCSLLGEWNNSTYNTATGAPEERKGLGLFPFLAS